MHNDFAACVWLFFPFPSAACHWRTNVCRKWGKKVQSRPHNIQNFLIFTHLVFWTVIFCCILHPVAGLLYTLETENSVKEFTCCCLLCDNQHHWFSSRRLIYVGADDKLMSDTLAEAAPFLQLWRWEQWHLCEPHIFLSHFVKSHFIFRCKTIIWKQHFTILTEIVALNTVDLQLKTIIDRRAKFYSLDQLFLKKSWSKQ